MEVPFGADLSVKGSNAVMRSEVSTNVVGEVVLFFYLGFLLELSRLYFGFIVEDTQ